MISERQYEKKEEEKMPISGDRRIALNHRQIYEQHYGQIPIDSEGRRYDIHHIDGNHTNNHPSNLRAITIQEHYDIHLALGDHSACHLIALRMKKPPEEMSRLASLHNYERVASGDHPFVGQRNPVYKMTEDGTNPFFGPEVNLRKVANGTHPFSAKNLLTYVCQHCQKVGKGPAMKRWHLDNCREKDN